MSDVGADNYVGLSTEEGTLFESAVAGVYRIQPADALTIGEWWPGDPYFDFELDPRPASAGAVDLVGADEP